MNPLGQSGSPPQAPPPPPKRPANPPGSGAVQRRAQEQPGPPAWSRAQQLGASYSAVHSPVCAPESGGGAGAGAMAEEDTYEPPPCESLVCRVAPAKRLEDPEGTYLDQATARRLSEPCAPRPATRLWKLSQGLGTEAGCGEQGPWGLARGKEPSLPTWDNKEEPLEEEVYLACEPVSPTSCRTALALRPPPSQAPRPQPPRLPKPKLPLPRPGQSPAGASPEARSKASDWVGGSTSPVEDASVRDQEWYAGSCDRHMAERVLRRVNQDSAFLVRQSSGQGWNQPFALAVLYQGHVYNIPIRYVASSHQYLLGKDRQGQEQQRFDSVAGLIQHYREHPLVLINGSSASRVHACLLFPVRP
ncbi:SH2 domain-containing protein 6 isoform X2 [Carettochelys insculpta]|uniref:SH2 domain-containing protein 6 isoform X2 n=1 Tax=Carettochelys insculpta TaxID=44489 RepID=UPI003EC11C13